MSLVHHQTTERTTPAPTRVVGIGASAGGLYALQDLFDNVPEDSGLAFVVIQHLSPDFKSLMDELLQSRTGMPVKVIEDGMPLEPNRVYLNVPRRDVALTDDFTFELHDEERAPHELHHPINSFFRTLALRFGANAIGIVLSGTGTDGAAGVVALRESGALVIVQDPHSAEFDGMPLAAKRTGMVDVFLPPQDIGPTLTEMAAKRLQNAPAAKRDEDLDSYSGIFQLLQGRYGIDFAHYKAPTVGRRIQRRLDFGPTTNLDDYVEQLRTDPAELDNLYRDLLIGVTKFFRDEEAFELISRVVLPHLASREQSDGLRVWVSGCATGEEVYSLAILLDEFRRAEHLIDTFTIFGTDVHEASLAKAGEGFYDAEALAHMDTERLDRYFSPEPGGFKVKKELRNRIVFAAHNLLEDAPFTKLDMITCRNLLIYIEPSAQQAILSTFHYGLKPNGVLFLGPSENLGELSSSFEPMHKRWKIYRKSRDVLPHGQLRLPVRSGVEVVKHLQPRAIRRGRFENAMSRGYDALLSRCGISGLLIDERRHALHFFGDSNRFLRLRGRMTDDVLELVDHQLRTALSAAIHRVSKEDVPALYRSVPCEVQNESLSVDVSVEPLTDPKSKSLFMLITLQAEPLSQLDRTSEPTEVADASHARIQALEDELRITRESLQATLEESDTTNEELQATNEELVASNEELKSTNEELQSVNEELYTVNAEYQQKIAQLTQLTNDMDNLLGSTEIGTIFLDRAKTVRKFTPAAAQSFSLLGQDVGRPIEHITHALDYDGLREDVDLVLTDEKPRAREVRSRDGTWFLVRLSPYRTDDAACDGVVITLVDISDIKAVEIRLARSNERYRSLFDASEASLWEQDVTQLLNRLAGITELEHSLTRHLAEQPSEVTQLARLVNLVDVNEATLRMFEAESKEEFRDSLDRVFIDEYFPVFHDLLIALARGETRYEAIATLGTLKDRRIKVHLMFSLLPEEDVRRRAIVSIMDITSEVEAELLGERAAELQRSNSELERFAYVASHDLQAPLRAVVNYMHLLRKKAEHLDADAAEYIEVASRSALRMKEQIDALLEFSRVNRPERPSEPVDVHRLLCELRDELRSDAETPKGTKFIFENLPTIHGHRYQFAQIFQNLFSNAIKFRGDSVPEIRIVAKARQPGWLFEVRDNGIGMSDDQTDRIFEVFTRLHARDEYSGTGIGLAVVKRVIEFYGGKIWVSSAPGVGSRFLFTLHDLPTDRR